MAIPATKCTTVRIFDNVSATGGTVKAAPGRVFWIAASSGATGGFFQVENNTAATGSAANDKFDVNMPASMTMHYHFDPPIECSTGIYVDIPGTNITLSIGYE